MGGYKIIDFLDTNLVSGNGVKIAGTYNAIEANYRKPTLIHRLTIDGVEQTDVFAQFVVADSNFKTEIAQGSIVITDDDTVSFIANE